MTLVIDATVGGASANSFILLAEAQTFMDARLNSTAWSGASTATQNIALVEATRELSAKEWDGLRVTSSQVLSWPRAWAVNPDVPLGSFWYYDSTIIPQRIKDATAELALQFLNLGTTDLGALDPNLGVIEKTIDVITTRWQAYQRPATGLARFPSVMKYIKPLLSAGGNSVPLIRG